MPTKLVPVISFWGSMTIASVYYTTDHLYLALIWNALAIYWVWGVFKSE